MTKPERPTRSIPLPGGRRPLTRRARAVAGVAAVAAVLAVAGAIGSSGIDATTDASGSSTKAGRTTAPTASSPGESGESGAGGGVADEAFAPPTTAVVGAYESGDGSAVPDRDSGAGSAGSDASTATSPAGSGTGNRLEPKIVRTGSVDLVVKRGSFDRAAARLSTLATGAGGFVSASQTSALHDAPQGTITLRVPVDRFDDLVAQVRKLGKVSSLSTGSQDVTGEYSDVAARIKALRDEREQITLVLGRAESIPDILSVRDRLSVVQGELEQLQGRQQVLDDQTSLSTLAVSLREQGRPSVETAPPAERSGFDKLWHDAGDRFTDGLRAIALGLATLAPWLLLALVLALPMRALWRRLAPPPAADPA